jgi:hypothetical protein
MGLDKIRLLLKIPNSTLRIEFSNSFNETNEFVEFSYFTIKDSTHKYVLELGTETKRSSETLINFRDYHNGMQFTTFDYKNDENPKINCALKWGVGWWFKNCFQCSNASYFDSRNNLLSFVSSVKL